MSTNNRIDLVEFSAASEEDLQASKSFFGNVFGWSYTDYGPEYADTPDSGVTSGINATGNARREPLAVIYVDDLEGALNRVTEAGGKIVQEIFSFPGGRRFHFVEPAGNEVAVWSDKP